MTAPIQYNVLIEKDGKSVHIDWGNTPKWMETYKELMDTADRITLVPKTGVNMPVASVVLGEERRWVLFSRVFGELNTRTNEQKDKFRLYSLGWQATVNGKNVKSLTWIYPNGMVEIGEEPSFAKYFLGIRPVQ